MTRAEAAALLAVLERRETHSDADFAAHLFDKQLAYFHDRSRAVAVRAGRRGGKTTAVAPRLLRKLHQQPNRWSLYLALTRKSAQRILLPAVTQVLRDLGIGHRVNRTDLEVHLHGGGSLLMGGVDTQDQIERYRGLGYVEVAIDECGSFPSIRLESLVRDVLRPALMDHQGCLTLTGTPGHVPAGYWWEMSGPGSTIPVYHWTALDNPHIPHAAEEMAEVREANGWTEDNPTYLREWMGLWVEDLGALVYPYAEERNACPALPLQTPNGLLVDPSLWRYTIGVDIGVVEATAIVVVASHPELPEDYFIHAEKILDMRADVLASRLHDLRVLFPGPIVCDTQGIGKAHADELRSRFGLPIESATKQEKTSAIVILRDRILAGQIKVLPEAVELRDEWRVVVWDELRVNHKRDQDDHCSDAALYAVRRHRNYRTGHRALGPEVGSREYYEQQERAIVKRRERLNRHRRSILDS